MSDIDFYDETAQLKQWKKIAKYLCHRIAVNNDGNEVPSLDAVADAVTTAIASPQLEKFEEHVKRFAQSELSKDQLIASFAMGLSGEAGEVTDLLKKHLFHGKLCDLAQLISELGDVIWINLYKAVYLEVSDR